MGMQLNRNLPTTLIGLVFTANKKPTEPNLSAFNKPRCEFPAGSLDIPGTMCSVCSQFAEVLVELSFA